MKIGILTFHTALNAGAVLQAYALQRYLSDCGHVVEIIDYRPRKHYRLRHFAGKSFRVIINRWRDLYHGCKYAHNGVFTKHLKMGAVHYNDEYKLRKNILGYDIYIVGSDQVWNYTSGIMKDYFLLSLYFLTIFAFEARFSLAVA